MPDPELNSFAARRGNVSNSHISRKMSKISRLVTQDAKTRREDLGVELFGYQQQLRGIYKSLEDSKERDDQLAVLASTTDANLQAKEQELRNAETLSQERNARVCFLSFSVLAVIQCESPTKSKLSPALVCQVLQRCRSNGNRPSWRS